ncbi:beta-eliminating lyase-related protein [Bacteroidota bacterium]
MKEMRRRDFIKLGSVLAASAGAVQAFPIMDNLPVQNSSAGKSVDFVYDGLRLSPEEYTEILFKLADEGKIKSDYYSNGGVVEELEKKFAKWLGKESAVFFPTGTMANHLAIRLLADKNKRVIVQAESHIYNDSGDCCQNISGLNLITLGKDSHTFTLDDVKKVISKTASGRVKTPIGVISIESPVRRQNDRSFGFDRIKEISNYARNEGIKLHMDGARLFAEAAHLNRHPSDYAKYFDTVYTSLYKCFNAASGAVLAGTKEFTEDLFHIRRMFGGGLPNVWPFAAVALQYIDSYIDDYKSAWKKAEEFFKLLEQNPKFKIEEFDDGTHIVRLNVKDMDLYEFVQRIRAENISIMGPRPGEKWGGIPLKINPSLNKISTEKLALIFNNSL